MHVSKWINQFDEAHRAPILVEMDAMLGQTYISKAAMESFLLGLVSNTDLVGDNPEKFWPTVNFLDIQGGGNSQRDILAMFGSVLKANLGIKIANCGKQNGLYVYLDDIIFTGNRVRRDLEKWILHKAPAKAIVHVIVGAYHTGGQWYAEKKIEEAVVTSKKSITFMWWRLRELEDRTNRNNTSDVFRPSSLPSSAAMIKYRGEMNSEPPLRDEGRMGSCQVFKDEQGRNILEQQLLLAGLRIRALCPNLPLTCRPLGYSSANSGKTLGFGSTLVTHRNCPNNCPLAFWVGHPWYPLFPRKNNA